MVEHNGLRKAASVATVLDRYFGLTKERTSLAQEARAGVTTFLTMAYVLFVNPEVLGRAISLEGVDVRGQLLVTTALAAALGSAVMGLWARYPFALAPGMGINAFFTFGIVLGLGVPWQTALGVVFLSGVLFVALSVGGVRELVVNAIPPAIKAATTAGIGMFLAVIGLKSAGLIEAHQQTLVSLGDVGQPGPLLALAGLLVTASLLALRVRGALLIGIAATTVLALALDAPVYGGQSFRGTAGALIQIPAWPSDLFMQMDLAGAFSLKMLGVILVFLFVDLFDTAGTLLGLAHRCGYATPDGRLPRADAAFAADAIATTAGAVLGTSNTTTYIESAAGIEDGGRTGLTAVVVAVLFLGATFFSPLAAMVPAVATAPALIIVGAMMMGSVRHIDWTDHAVALPAFLTVVGMPLTYSIANGISAGIVTYTLLQVGTGKLRQVSALMYILTALLVLRYAFLSEV